MSATSNPPAAAELCPTCASPLAADQRYCLACGEVRPGARRPLPADLRRTNAGEPVPAIAPAARPPLPSLATGLAALACLLLATGVGVLIGRSGRERTAAAPITISGAAAAAPNAGSTSTAASFQSDWPPNRAGWTIALRSLPKDTSDPAAVATAKTAAAGRHAPAVGALDSDAYPSLTAGSYVVYSGIFRTRDLARRALAPLSRTFAGARVVQVATTAPAAAASPSKRTARTRASKPARSGSGTKSAFDESRKQPKTLGTGGKPPPKDHKAAAGGGGFQDIG